MRHPLFSFINPWLEFVLNDLRSCCHCGAALGLTPLICAECEQTLRALYSPRKISFGSYLAYVPFTWAEKEGLIASLVRGQKGGVSKPASKMLAKHMVSSWLEQSSLCEPAVLVPAPQSQGRRRNHAQELAQAISAQTGWPVLPILQRGPGQKAQKHLKRDKRADLKIFSLGKLPSASVKVILVDDLITTGSTVSGCYLALGQPQRFEVWALAYRELSFGLRVADRGAFTS